MKSEPMKEHTWLKRLIGEWEYEGECQQGPGKPTSKSTGRESVRALGDFWVLGEGTMSAPDGTDGQTLISLGYDSAKAHFVGSWLGSMMPMLWIYRGELDLAKQTLSLESEGPDMVDYSKMSLYRDIIAFKSDDHRILSSEIQQPDGSWQRFMEVHYRRK
jgi:hypothetical protein